MYIYNVRVAPRDALTEFPAGYVCMYVVYISYTYECMYLRI